MLKKVLDLLKKIVSIPSISPNDFGCQDILIDYLRSLGFVIENLNFKDTKNFFAYKGSGKSFLFSGHTDVVPPGCLDQWKTPPFHPKLIGNIFFGRGSSDMKGALVAMLIATESFLKKYPNSSGQISWIITSDEESSGINGIKKVVSEFLSRKKNFDYCLLGEPTSENVLGDCIKNGRRGSINGSLIINGIQGHVAYPSFSRNAVHCSLPFLNELINLKWERKKSLSEASITFNIYNIYIKNAISNIIPGKIFIDFNIRFPSCFSKEKIKDRIILLLKKYHLNFSIKWFFSSKPYYLKSSFLSKKIIDCIYKITNVKSVIKTSGGTSDGRFLYKISNEIIEFGLINKTIHQANECVNILDILLLCKIYEKLLIDIFINN